MQNTIQRANCFARTLKGTLMPGIRLGKDEEGQVIVQPVHSTRQYSFPEEAILSVQDAWRSIVRRRIQQVAGNYMFEVIYDSPQVVHCYNPEHPRRSNYILAQGPAGWTCTCPSYARLRGCKHLAAYAELQRILEPPPQPTALAIPLEFSEPADLPKAA